MNLRVSPRRNPRRNPRRSRFLTLAASVLAVAPVAGQTKYPNIDWVFPTSVTRGTDVEVEVRADGDLESAYQVLVEEAGVSGEVLPRESGDAKKKLPKDRARVRLTVDGGAAVGSRDVRLATADAITTLGRIYVTDLPTVTEQDGAHGDAEHAQTIAPPCVVNGRLEGAVELDWYRFEARAGERVSFEVLGTRLHETIQKIGRFTPHFDALLTVTDAGGRELALNDDYYFADPLLSFVAPDDGEYRVLVREANYKGHASYSYSLVARRGPITTLTFPLACAPGEMAEVELLGSGRAAGERGTVALPAEAVPGRVLEVPARAADGAAARPVSVLASALRVAIEGEEALAVAANDPPAEAEGIELPVGIAGRLSRPDGADCFRFEAAGGTRYRFEVFARRLFSPLDSVLEILDGTGRVVGTGDDTRDLAGQRSRDTELLWTAPEEGGRYTVRVRDLHSRGGPGFVYHLECSRAEPDFELTFDPELAMVGPGNRTPIYVRADRRNGFEGEIGLAVEGLPAGVEALVAPVRSGMTDACVVLSAAAGAARGAASFRIHGSAELATRAGSVRVTRRALPLVEIYQAQRVLGRTSAVAVTTGSDIEVTTTVHEVVLKPGEAKVIPIRLVRGERYPSGSVSLWGMWRFGNRIFGSSLPPGVEVDEGLSSTGIIGEGVDGALALRAQKDAAPISGVQTVVIGLIPIEFSVFVPFCTRPILVTVTKEDGSLAAGGN